MTQSFDGIIPQDTHSILVRSSVLKQKATFCPIVLPRVDFER